MKYEINVPDEPTGPVVDSAGREYRSTGRGWVRADGAFPDTKHSWAELLLKRGPFDDKPQPKRDEIGTIREYNSAGYSSVWVLRAGDENGVWSPIWVSSPNLLVRPCRVGSDSEKTFLERSVVTGGVPGTPAEEVDILAKYL